MCLYVDDFIFIGNDNAMFSDFKRSMMDEFEMSNPCKIDYFLGLKVVQSGNVIFVFQKKYVRELLD